MSTAIGGIIARSQKNKFWHLILYIPGEKPQTIDAITSHMDIAPTLLELMGSDSDHSSHSFGNSLLSEKFR